jgi:hypothetical protein
MIRSTTATLECAAHVKCGGEQDVDQLVGRDRTQQDPQARYVFKGGNHRKQVLKRNQDETKPDPHPAEVTGARHAAAPEHEYPDQDEQERNPRDVER